MRIKWYGTASLMIESGGSRILIDPYLKTHAKKLPPVPVDEATSADAIFITHPHFDHFQNIGEFAKNNVKKIYVSQNGIQVAKKNKINTDLMSPLADGDIITVGDITVRAFTGRHCKFDLFTVLGVALNPLTYCHLIKGITTIKNTFRFKMNAETDIFILEISSGGKRAVVLGSAGMDENTIYPDGADLLVFPYQGRTRMHMYIKKFLRVFNPKSVMLDHFDNAFPPFTHQVSTKKFIPAAEEVLPGIKAFVPTENEWYDI